MDERDKAAGHSRLLLEPKNEVGSKTSGNGLKVTRNAKALGFAVLLFLSTAAGFAGGWLGAVSQRESEDSITTTQQRVLNESEVISELAEKVGQSVVSVNVTSEEEVGNGVFSRILEQESAGTGFIISKEGIIVTNRHVVPSGTSTVGVTLSDGTEYNDVEVIGRTSEGDSLDIAFLKIRNRGDKELKPVELGDSSDVEVGERVIAIGNALGQFQNTVTSGIISGYGRDVEAGDSRGNSETLQNLFQTDTAINQGNSGGPLVDINGKVIGINTAVAGNGAENIGFAIPINDVKGLIEGVLATGKLLRPYLGVRYISLTDSYAVEFGLDVKRGAYIVPGEPGQPSVIEGSPAERAGLKAGDVIVKINDASIDQSNSLTSVLGRFKVGNQVTVTYVRDGKERTVLVLLEALPED